MIDTATVASLPIERLLTETDGPLVEIAYRPVRPSDVEVTIAASYRAGSVVNLEADVIARYVARNLRQ